MGRVSSVQDAQFTSGEQDLSHEQLAPIDAQLPEVEAPIALSEDSVRRLVRLTFTGAAAVRNKEYYRISEQELDELVPDLTAYIARHAALADAVQAAADGSGPLLLVLAFFRRALRDWRESRQARDEPVIDDTTALWEQPPVEVSGNVGDKYGW